MPQGIESSNLSASAVSICYRQYVEAYFEPPVCSTFLISPERPKRFELLVGRYENPRQAQFVIRVTLPKDLSDGSEGDAFALCKCGSDCLEAVLREFEVGDVQLRVSGSDCFNVSDDGTGG